MARLSTVIGRGTTGAKPAAASSPAGSLYFDTDLGKLQRSTGAAWEDVEASGLVPTAHAASHQNAGGDEISVAGLSGELADLQPVKAHAIDGADHTAAGLTAGHVMKATAATTFAFGVNPVSDLVTTKGDLVVGTAADALARLGAGANGKFLKALSTEATGLEWGDALAGSAHVIQEEGTPLTARANLNFVGAGVAATDDAGNDATVVTIAGGGGGADFLVVQVFS